LNFFGACLFLVLYFYLISFDGFLHSFSFGLLGYLLLIIISFCFLTFFLSFFVVFEGDAEDREKEDKREGYLENRISG